MLMARSSSHRHGMMMSHFSVTFWHGLSLLEGYCCYDLSERIVGRVVNPTVPSQTEYILGFGIR